MSRYKKKAVALKYNAESDVAPVVIASGCGHIAEKIIDIAEKKGIPVYRDDSTASLLCMLEVGNNIPPEVYQVVAAIYCQLLKTSEKIKNGQETGGRGREAHERMKRLAARTSYRNRGGSSIVTGKVAGKKDGGK